VSTRLTPFQTIGPFFHHALLFKDGETLTADATVGQRIVIEGTVRDGAGAPVAEALIEIWQADAAGRYNHPGDGGDRPPDTTFDGFGRAPTDEAGNFSFVTIKPGSVPDPSGGKQAPHVLVSVFARGILTRLVTRIYFDGEPANDSDPILAMVPVERRPTLLARREGEGRYRFDIRLQGDGETVFLDV
jgi:protocatechuate 3,4-dioxygenase alpha subunit